MIDFNNSIENFENNLRIQLILQVKETCEEDKEFYKYLRDYIFKKEGIVLASQMYNK